MLVYIIQSSLPDFLAIITIELSVENLIKLRKKFMLPVIHYYVQRAFLLDTSLITKDKKIIIIKAIRHNGV